MDKNVAPMNETVKGPSFLRSLLSPNASTTKDLAENPPVIGCEAAQPGRSHQRTRVLLQDCQTRKFMRCDSLWSENINEALDFVSAPKAAFYGMKELKSEFRILQIGHTGIVSTAVVKLGQLKWSKSPRAAHVADRFDSGIWSRSLALMSLGFGQRADTTIIPGDVSAEDAYPQITRIRAV